MQLKFGEIYKIKELLVQFGGNRQSGISAPAKLPVIFLINSDEKLFKKTSKAI